jgi:hypothetical protein
VLQLNIDHRLMLKKQVPIDEIATVPAAPPSRLSKKLIELQIPTTQITVIIESKIFDPVGFPTFSNYQNTCRENPAIL